MNVTVTRTGGSTTSLRSARLATVGDAEGREQTAYGEHRNFKAGSQAYQSNAETAPWPSLAGWSHPSFTPWCHSMGVATVQISDSHGPGSISPDMLTCDRSYNITIAVR